MVSKVKTLRFFFPKYIVCSASYFLLKMVDNGFKKIIDTKPIIKNEIKVGVIIFHKDRPKVLDMM